MEGLKRVKCGLSVMALIKNGEGSRKHYASYAHPDVEDVLEAALEECSGTVTKMTIKPKLRLVAPKEETIHLENGRVLRVLDNGVKVTTDGRRPSTWGL
jgi:hypothetical protein